MKRPHAGIILLKINLFSVEISDSSYRIVQETRFLAQRTAVRNLPRRASRYSCVSGVHIGKSAIL